MSKKPLVAGVVLIAAVAAGGWWYLQKKEAEPFYFAGTVEATKVDVPARLATVISTVNVVEGAKVEKGQSLVALECEDLALQNTLVTENYKRGERLVKVGSMPRETFDQVKSKRDEVALKLTWCGVQSPINGTVLSRYKEPGEWVAPGVKLLTVADLDRVWAYVYVPEPMLATLKTGMQVKGYLPELGMRALSGEIIKINEEAEFTPKNVQTREERTRLVFGIKVMFDNKEGLLKPGMPVEVDLPDGQHG